MPATVQPLFDASAGQRRYAALASALRRRVIAGEWPAGSALPSEQLLAAEHGVALGTLRQALGVLAQTGVVERVHGRGTFVRGGLSGAPMLRFFRFGSGSAEAPQSRILSRQTVGASADVARVLGQGLARGELVLRIKRLRSIDGQACLLEDIWLPLPRFEPLASGDPADWGPLLYPAFAERCGVVVHRAVDSLSFDVFGAVDARWLKLPPGHPCAKVTRQAFDLAGQCVEHRVTRGDAHAFHYSVTIT